MNAAAIIAEARAQVAHLGSSPEYVIGALAQMVVNARLAQQAAALELLKAARTLDAIIESAP